MVYSHFGHSNPLAYDVGSSPLHSPTPCPRWSGYRTPVGQVFCCAAACRPWRCRSGTREAEQMFGCLGPMYLKACQPHGSISRLLPTLPPFLGSGSHSRLIMPPTPASNPLSHYEELMSTEKHYPVTSSPSIHNIPPCRTNQNDCESGSPFHSHSSHCSHHHQHNSQWNHGSKASRARRFLFSVLFIILTLGVLMTIGCASGASGYLPSWASSLGLSSAADSGSGAIESLIKRAGEAAADTGSGGNVFVEKKCTPTPLWL